MFGILEPESDIEQQFPFGRQAAGIVSQLERHFGLRSDIERRNTPAEYFVPVA